MRPLRQKKSDRRRRKENKDEKWEQDAKEHDKIERQAEQTYATDLSVVQSMIDVTQTGSRMYDELVRLHEQGTGVDVNQLIRNLCLLAERGGVASARDQPPSRPPSFDGSGECRDEDKKIDVMECGASSIL